MVSALNQFELKYLSTCLHVAAENLAFYEQNYKAVTTEPHKSILGRLMAQKKECVQALGVLSMSKSEPKPPLQKLGFELEGMPQARHNPNQRSVQKFPSMVRDHEGRYKQALETTISKVKDPATQFMLKNHLEAAQIGLNAINDEIQNYAKNTKLNQ